MKANFKKSKLKVTHHRGPIHDYLEIGLDYSDKGKLKLSMIPYLCDVIEGFLENIEQPTHLQQLTICFRSKMRKMQKFLAKKKQWNFIG